MTGDESALRELLHSATPDLGSLLPPADLRPARQPRRTRFIAVAAAIVVVATVAIVIGLTRQSERDSRRGIANGPSQPRSTVSGNPRAARHPLTVQILLDQTTVPAGRPISGVATVTNSAAHPLTIADCHGTWLQVGLSNDQMTNTPAWLQCLSVPGTILQPGTTRIPIRVNTTYDQCTPRANSATAEMPACVHGGDGLAMPPLPPGTYHTTTGILEPEGVHVPTPESIQVTLTP